MQKKAKDIKTGKASDFLLTQCTILFYFYLILGDGISFYVCNTFCCFNYANSLNVCE